MSFDPTSNRPERDAAPAPSHLSPVPTNALTEDDEKMIVLQSWYQRMSAERISRHHGIPVGEVRRILARRMGGSC